MTEELEINPNDIAIVGMSLRVPGAHDTATYWRNLRAGVESIRAYQDEELIANGESPDLLKRSNYVRAAAPLDGMELFDGEFFGFSPKECAILDPQHRHFYELAWEALETAAYVPEKFEGPIGVWAGCGMGSYFYFHLCSNPELVRNVGMFLLRHTGNDKDFLSTRVSYLLNLKGPAIGVQTACSTSLVAVHLACQSLLAREVDMAIAGGVTIELPHRRGYLFHEGEILSPDGHCHAFDHRAQGTVFGSGAGAVVLRRLEDAVRDGDIIHAVIRGTAINNDGSDKVNYLAPSVDGQARCMAEAHAIADVSPDTIDYVECHGTGTYLGDPIEIAALTQAFRRGTKRVGYCRIGSVKSNIGHLDTAAGAASLIKATLALREKQMPPSLSYEKPNPTIDFETSPFVVNDRLRDWPRGKTPRRAAVNSLGVGGTNAHVILEEAPVRASSTPSAKWQLLTISGRNAGALQGNTQRLTDHLRSRSEQPLADIAWTLHEGRKGFEKRRVVVCKTHEEGASLLESNDPKRVFTHTAVDKPEVAFLFPGGGSQYASMGAGLYANEPVFKEHIDKGVEILQRKHDIDLAPFLKRTLTSTEELETANKALEPMPFQLPAIFLVEYALAKLWESWGVKPTALLGHSLGENTAACLAGVMRFEDALGLVALRGKLFARVPGGAMLSVNLGEDEVRAQLAAFTDLDIAVINVPDVTVVSGPASAIDQYEAWLKAKDLEPKRLAIPVAAHSRALEPILEEFRAYLKSIPLSAPKLRLLSNRSGTWMTAEQATSADYWVEHLRGTVQFSKNLTTLLENKRLVVIEVGPGKTLSSLSKQHPSGGIALQSVVSLRHRDEDVPDDAFFLSQLGRVWASGAEFDWSRMWKGETRQRVELPTYAFQKQHYFIERNTSAQRETASESTLYKRPDMRDWGYVPVWNASATPKLDARFKKANEHSDTWLIFIDQAGIGERLAERLEARGQTVISVREGDTFTALPGGRSFTLAPERGREGYSALIRDLVGRGISPAHIVHGWLLTQDESHRPGSSFFHRNQERGFYSLLFLAQALSEETLATPPRWTILANGMLAVDSDSNATETLPYPEKSTVLGPAKIIPRELTGSVARVLDIHLPAPRQSVFGGKLGMAFVDPFAGRNTLEKERDQLALKLEREVLGQWATGQTEIAALRDAGRFVQEYEAVSLEPAVANATGTLREGATVLITGGLGGLGLLIGEHLARSKKANLVLLSRSELPPRETWDAHIRAFGEAAKSSQQIDHIRRLEALGAKVAVVSADVTIEMELEEAIRVAKARFGSIDAVVHAAGVVRDGLLSQKTQGECEEVFTPKIHGTLTLERVLKNEPLTHFIAFSSSSSVIAPRGQVDYIGANAFLNAFVRSRRSTKTRYVALAWGIWSDVGMAHESMAQRTNTEVWKTVARAEHPLFDARQKSGQGRQAQNEIGLLAHYEVKSRFFLDEHRTKAGNALIPGTGYLELARAAMEELGERERFEIQDLFFIRPLGVSNDEVKEVRVVLRPTDLGYGFEVRSRVQVEGRWAWELHAQAQLALTEFKNVAPLRLADIEGRCQLRRQASPTGLTTSQEKHLQFGPRWKVLREVLWGRGEAIAELSLDPSFADETGTYKLHPALVDIATGYAMDLIEGYDGTNLWVPVSYESVRIQRALPSRIRSWVKVDPDARQSGDFASFDVVLTDIEGNVCVEIKRFTIKKLEGAIDVTERSRKPVSGELMFEEDTTRELSPAEEQLKHNLAQGILASEGADAFERALALSNTLGSPEVLVSTLDLQGLFDQAQRATEEKDEGDGAKFARPNLGNEYVAPRDDLERTLVGLFQDLLGVDMVGVEDSFFDLGGHSLIAVRLFASIKKTYKAEFPISLLFEAATASRIAQRVREKVGVSSPEASTTVVGIAAPDAPRMRHKHLVAMHPGADGPATRRDGSRPFFLVAGMFGNVLNLRHLAHLVGEERPFYGLQARGLYGEESPHATFEEMSAAYLAEIRSVQPHGPYMLGGFSGGGITAYQMAQDLRALGEEVSLLVMLDTPVPVRAPLTSKDRALIQVEELKQKGVGYFGEWAEKRVQWELGKLKRRFEEPAAENTTVEFHNDKMEAAFRDALHRYDLKAYAGKVMLYRPKLVPRWKLGETMVDKDRHYMTVDNGWTPWVQSLEVIEVPGDHDAMVLEPNVRVLAKRMRKAIEDAEGATKKR